MREKGYIINTQDNPLIGGIALIAQDKPAKGRGTGRTWDTEHEPGLIAIGCRIADLGFDKIRYIISIGGL